MKEFYNKITNVLTNEQAIEKFTENSVKAVQQVDLYRGQYLYEEEFEQLLLPTVLVEFTINHETQKATIILHCCWEQIFESDNKSVDQESALKLFDFVDVIFDLTNDLESENTGKLKIISEGTQKDDTPTNVYLLTFECSYMGRVKKASDKYNYATGDDLSTVGTIKPKVIQNYDYNL